MPVRLAFLAAVTGLLLLIFNSIEPVVVSRRSIEMPKEPVLEANTATDAVMDELLLDFSIQSSGTIQASELITQLSGSIVFYRKSLGSSELNDSLARALVFKFIEASGSVTSAKKEKPIELESVRNRLFIVSPPMVSSTSDQTAISHTGQPLSSEAHQVVRLVVQNLHLILLTTGDKEHELRVSRRDLYGEVDWRWQKVSDESKNEGIRYTFRDVISPKSLNALEHWKRSLNWRYFTDFRSISLDGDEKIELYVGKNKVLDLVVTASFVGEKTAYKRTEKSLLADLSDLHTFHLNIDEGSATTKVSTQLSWDDAKKILLTIEPQPIFYAELATILTESLVSQKEISLLLSKLKKNSASYVALVRALAFSNNKHKGYLINHIKTSDTQQKINLIPLLSQGYKTDRSVIQFLSGISKSSKNRNLRAASALTLGTSYSGLDKGSLTGNVSKDSIYDNLRRRLEQANTHEDIVIWLSALGNTGNPLLVEDVRRYLNHKKAYVREKAFHSLRNIKSKPEASKSIAMLIECLGDENSDVRKRCAITILSLLKNNLNLTQDLKKIEIELQQAELNEDSSKVKKILAKVNNYLTQRM